MASARGATMPLSGPSVPSALLPETTTAMPMGAFNKNKRRSPMGLASAELSGGHSGLHKLLRRSKPAVETSEERIGGPTETEGDQQRNEGQQQEQRELKKEDETGLTKDDNPSGQNEGTMESQEGTQRDDGLEQGFQTSPKPNFQKARRRGVMSMRDAMQGNFKDGLFSRAMNQGHAGKLEAVNKGESDTLHPFPPFPPSGNSVVKPIQNWPNLRDAFINTKETAKRAVSKVIESWSPGRTTRPKTPIAEVPKFKLEEQRKARGKIKFASILKITSSKEARRKALANLERDFSSNTSRKSKSALRATVKTILDGLNGTKGPLPATPDKVKLLAGVLKDAEYKSAHLYLGEYKLMAVESGQAWSDMLARTLQQCKRSVARAVGPKKKAPEVRNFSDKTNDRNPKKTSKLKVNLAKELFDMGVIWMLREVELSAIQKEHISMNPKSKMVSLTLPVSKTDQAGTGAVRVLQCVCQGDCDALCPWQVSKALVDGMRNLGTDEACITKDGKKATKMQLVKDWKVLFGGEITGHSARRTGALRYIRLHWPLAQVAYLGRWKSNVIYDYAAEALASLPVNNNPTFGHSVGLSDKPTETKELQLVDNTRIEEVRNYLQVEMESLKSDQSRAFEMLDAEVKVMKERGSRRGDRLPLLVQATASKIVHQNMDIPNCSPPLSWKTRCGWHYFKSEFVFITEVGSWPLCKKCVDPLATLLAPKGNEVEDGEMGTKDKDRRSDLWGPWMGQTSTNEKWVLALVMEIKELFWREMERSAILRGTMFWWGDGGMELLPFWLKAKRFNSKFPTATHPVKRGGRRRDGNKRQRPKVWSMRSMDGPDFHQRKMSACFGDGNQRIVLF